jgi:hypothetical protein
MRSKVVSKNRSADLINIALERVIEAGLELPGFTTLDALAAVARTEVNAAICTGIYDQFSEAHRERHMTPLRTPSRPSSARGSRAPLHTMAKAQVQVGGLRHHPSPMSWPTSRRT